MKVAVADADCSFTPMRSPDHYPARVAVTSLFLLLAWTGLAFGAAAPALPQIPDKTFSVTDHGTKADGKTKDTDAIARALQAAEQAGGGTVRFPAGTYLTGAVQLRSKVRLHLEKGATLLMSTDPGDYPVVLTRWEGTECMNYSGLIWGRDAHDIAITGEGTIDGQGQAWWPWRRPATPAIKRLREMGETQDDPTQRVFGTPEAGLRPCLFEPINCQRVLIEGVTFTNSPFWTIHPIYCTDVTARGATARGNGPNTDGLNPDSCVNVLIERCTFDTGDDCVTIKSGRDRDGRRVGRPTENVVVRDCTFARGHGTVVIGSEMSGGVRNVVAENVVADGNDAGVRIKTRRGRGGVVENITYRNMTIKNIQKQAITIDMFYDVGNNPDVDQSGPEGIPAIRNVLIENLRCESAATAIVIRGLPDSPIQGVKLRDVEISAARGTTISDARDVDIGNLSLKVSAGAAPATTNASH
ncbi:MAG TPA: glycoside hydrolase family 28 protein [Tepidisphaeraceae bacterium]|nr:glycoside hydrolase family 28 protein [Tepidisphaeraceae bacterium]